MGTYTIRVKSKSTKCHERLPWVLLTLVFSLVCISLLIYAIITAINKMGRYLAFSSSDMAQFIIFVFMLIIVIFNLIVIIDDEYHQRTQKTHTLLDDFTERCPKCSSYLSLISNDHIVEQYECPHCHAKYQKNVEHLTLIPS